MITLTVNVWKQKTHLKNEIFMLKCKALILYVRMWISEGFLMTNSGLGKRKKSAKPHAPFHPLIHKNGSFSSPLEIVVFAFILGTALPAV